MAESIRIPAHVENGAIHLDAPLPAGVVSVEVVAEIRHPEAKRVSVTEFLRALPPGGRSVEEIDDDFREMRADRI